MKSRFLHPGDQEPIQSRKGWPSIRRWVFAIGLFLSVDVSGATRCRFDLQCPVSSVCEAGECRTSKIKSSEVCREKGICLTEGAAHKKGDTCIADSNDACRASKVCKLDGRCRALAGLCQASDQAACRKLRPGKRPRLVRWPIGSEGRLTQTYQCLLYQSRLSAHRPMQIIWTLHRFLRGPVL